MERRIASSTPTPFGLDMLVAIRGSIGKLKREGKTLEQIITARPTAKFDGKRGNFVIDPAFFTRLVYRGV